MTKREYFRANKKVLLHLFKIIGIVATSIFAILFLLSSFRFNSVMDAFYLFLVCFVLGNLIAFSFTLLYFSMHYRPYADQLSVFESLSEDVKREFKITLYANPLTKKFSLLKHTIYSNYQDRYFEIRTDRSEKKIRVILFEKLDELDFGEAFSYINTKYQDDSISLTGLGLVKLIPVGNWKKLNKIDFKAVFLELLRISNFENLSERIIDTPED